MASRLTANEVVQLLEDDDFGLEEEDDSNFEGDEVESYLPQALSGLAITEPLAQSSQEDEEGMELEDVAEVEDSEMSEQEDRARVSSSIAYESGKP